MPPPMTVSGVSNIGPAAKDTKVAGMKLAEAGVDAAEVSAVVAAAVAAAVAVTV